MTIDQISIRGALPSPSLKLASSTPTLGTENAGQSFSNMLNNALQQIQGSQADADQAVQSLATGAPADLHDVMLRLEQASMTFQLGLQVRNKLVDAYQEVMRMQV